MENKPMTPINRNIYRCEGCRSVVKDCSELFNAGYFFAKRKARRLYGRKGMVRFVHGPFCVEVRNKDSVNQFVECSYLADIGRFSNAKWVTSRSIQFRVCIFDYSPRYIGNVK